MAVFPESMARLDPKDIRGSLGIIERYINYMTERMEFSNTNMTRNVSAAGVSTVEVIIAITEIQGALTTLQTTLLNFINSTGQNFTQVNDRLSSAEASITDLDERVRALEGENNA